MRLLAFVVVVLSLATSSVADARPARGTKRPARHATSKRPARHATPKRQVAVDSPAKSSEPAASRERARKRDRSIGAPWSGHLQAPARLPRGDGYVIRRPWRAFGTRTTVDLVHEAVTNTLEAFPKTHVLAIGDLSAETGGHITEHRSHQSGRDADLGLFYKHKPAHYPAEFAPATAKNLDCAATWKLLWEFARTANQDGGAQMIFLDYTVQGLIYRWAKHAGVSERRLDRVFQYPHGKHSGNGLVRHEPNHDNHMHVRFKCRDRDARCR
jgi:hypothetical protein